jgi:hypothetical protein
MPIAQIAAYSEQQQSRWHYTDISGPEATLATGILAALIIVIGWIVVHRTSLTREREARAHAERREKETRRSDLLSTLQHWHHTFVVVTEPTQSKRLYYHDGGMKELAAASEKFRSCVTDKDTFERLRREMCDMPPEKLDAAGPEGRRDTICGAIDRFAEFVRNA